MMNKREKFYLALEIYSDICAIRDEREMGKVKEFLFDALKDGWDLDGLKEEEE